MFEYPVILKYITYKFLVDKEPCSIVRIGNVEGNSLLGTADPQLFSNAGFYGDVEILRQWRDLFVEGIKESDIISYVVSCPSFFTTVGDSLTKLKIYKPFIPYLEFPEFYLEFWKILSVKNKKIGIISSMYKDIMEQVSLMHKIYPDFKINPDLFVVVESYNTCNDNKPEGHNNWLDTFEDLKNRVLEHKDVEHWFLSCGCYGIPLQNELKKNGKNSMYVGGLLQCLFGLLGKRWKDRPEFSSNQNIHWKKIEYLNLETLKNLKNVETGCYL